MYACVYLHVGFYILSKYRLPGTFALSSVEFSHSVVSNSLRACEWQHWPPCPSPTPRVYPNSCPLSWWCHPTISSSVVPFSSCPQSFPASGSFQMSLFFTSGGQSIGVSASTSVLPMNTQDWFPLGWTSWISSLSKGLSRVFSNTTVQKHLISYGLNLQWLGLGLGFPARDWGWVGAVKALTLNRGKKHYPFPTT